MTSNAALVRENYQTGDERMPDSSATVSLGQCLTAKYIDENEFVHVLAEREPLGKRCFMPMAFCRLKEKGTPTVDENCPFVGKNIFADHLSNYQTKPSHHMQILGAIVCSIVFMSTGVLYGYTGIVLPSMMDPKSGDMIITEWEAFIFVHISNIGAIVGSIISIPVTVWLGQRSTLLIFLFIGIAAWITLKFSYNIMFLLMSRAMQGLAIAVTVGSAGNYVTEISHESIRGRLHAVTGLSFQTGLLLVCLVGSTTVTWRDVGLICGLTTMVVPFVGMVFLPHSPRWLSTHGRWTEVEKSLYFFRGQNYNIAPEIKEIIHQSTSGKATVKAQFLMLKKRSITRRFMTISLLMFLSPFTGYLAMMTYTVIIFESSNVSINAYLSTVLTSITRIIGNAIYLLIADRLGRKHIFLPTQTLSGVCTILVGIFFFLKQAKVDVSCISWLPVTSLVFFTMFSSVSNSILAVWQSELLPNYVRAIGINVINIIYFMGAFSASLSYPGLVELIGSHWTFLIYGAVSLLTVIIAATFIPETRGKTLEEINEIFNKMG